MATGVDVSEWDVGRHPGMNWTAFFQQYDYVIVRVANENGYADVYAQMLTDAARASGKAWGCYAWPLIGQGFDANYAHAQHLVARWNPGACGMAADAERVGGRLANPDDIEGFCRGVQDAGHVALYYCACLELHRTAYLDTLPYWVADYGPNNGGYHDPYEQWPVPDRPWTVHQFTSLGWPGGGSLDVNYSPNLDWAGGGGVPPITPRPKENDLYIVRNRDSGARTLYTALGSTPNIDENFSNELQFAGVPYYDVPGGVADSLGLIHIGHQNGLVQAVDDAVGYTPGGGGGNPDKPLSAFSDQEIVDEANRRAGRGEIGYTASDK